MDDHLWSSWSVHPPKGRVLHAFCEQGAWVVQTAQRPSVSVCVGIDPVQSHVQSARKAAAVAGVDAVFCLTSAQEIAFAEETFDWVFAPALWERSTNPEAACREVMRVLAPDGVLVVLSEVLAQWHEQSLGKVRSALGTLRIQPLRAWDETGVVWACGEGEARSIAGGDGVVVVKSSGL